MATRGLIRHNSLGQLIRPTEAGIVNFWRWFGASKAVDAQGRPMVFFHGTNADFKIFDRSRSTKGPSKVGFWFTDDQNLASAYGEAMMPVYLRMLKPKRLSKEHWNRLREAHGGDAAWWGAWRDTALAGHDGVWVPGEPIMLGKFQVYDPGFFAVLSPRQVKSAIANTGQYCRRTDAIDNPKRRRFLDAMAYIRKAPAGHSRKRRPVPKYPLGTWRRDAMRGIYGYEVQQLRSVRIRDLEAPELAYGRKGQPLIQHLHPSKRANAAAYADILRNGGRLAPIEVVETDRGGLRVIDGHRRLVAHVLAGRSRIRAWVAPTAPHPEGRKDSEGRPMRVGLTEELMRGVQRNPRYPFFEQKPVGIHIVIRNGQEIVLPTAKFRRSCESLRSAMKLYAHLNTDAGVEKYVKAMKLHKAREKSK